MPKPDTCVKCGSELEHPETGRPKKFCDTPCRRAGEYELRRLQRAIEDLEGRERWTRHTLEVERYGSPEHYRKELAWLQAEIACLEGRLRELFEE